jgi:hypothetical protein
MAGYYQFGFGNSANSDITVQYSNDGSNWTTYSEPGWPPSPSNRGSVLNVGYNDEIFVWLSGPSGWSMGGALQVIIARANSAASGQAYSPFSSSVVWMNPPGSMDGTIWKASLGRIVSNPGQGQVNRFEITIAFNATLPGASGPAYFAEDPEMDVQGM